MKRWPSVCEVLHYLHIIKILKNYFLYEKKYLKKTLCCSLIINIINILVYYPGIFVSNNMQISNSWHLSPFPIVIKLVEVYYVCVVICSISLCTSFICKACICIVFTEPDALAVSIKVLLWDFPGRRLEHAHSSSKNLLNYIISNRHVLYATICNGRKIIIVACNCILDCIMDV